MLSNDVHIWKIPLDVNVFQEQLMLLGLSDFEKERAAKIRHVDTYRGYVISHFALRNILASYLNKPACDVGITVQQSGKPVLECVAESRLHFNLSHSADLALCAITMDLQIGVDVEIIREMRQLNDLVTRFFNPKEVEIFSLCPPEHALQKFFELWTAKEAYLKAIGLGLMGNLQVEPDSSWTVSVLEVESGYCGALAVQKPATVISYRDWS